MDVAAVDVAVRTGEVDILHRAHLAALVHRVVAAADTLPVDRHDLARLDVAHELGTQHVERAGFARHDIAVAQPADGQRTQAVFVQAGVNAVGGHDQERERPLQHVQRIDDRKDARPVVVAGLLLDQVGQNLAVRRGLEQTALVLQILAQQGRIDDVAVVGQREIARVVTEQKRLHVLDATASGGRIAHMADGRISLERRQFRLVEHLGHQSAALDAAESSPFVDGHDTRTLLSAVLQRMQAVIAQRCSVGHPEDAEHTALLMQLPVANLLHRHYSTIFCRRARISS